MILGPEKIGFWYGADAVKLLSDELKLKKQFKKLEHDKTIYYNVEKKCLTNKCDKNATLAIFYKEYEGNYSKYCLELNKLIEDNQRFLIGNPPHSGHSSDEIFAIVHHKLLSTDFTV